MRIPTKVKALWNGVFFICSVILLAVWYLVVFEPKLVNSFGEYITNQYVGFYSSRQSAAIKSLQQGDTEVTIALLEDWTTVLKGDRLYPLKRTLWIELLKRLDDSKRYAEMLQYSLLWVEHDDRDVSAKAYSLWALANTPGREQEGIVGLEVERSRFPKNVALEQFYQRATIPWRKGWVVFWDASQSFNAAHSSPAFSMIRYSERQWGFVITIPSDTRHLRIDPPPGARCEISSIKLSTGMLEWHISLPMVKVSMMENSNHVLKCNGAIDPYFYFDISGFHKDTVEEYQLKVRFDMSFPQAPARAVTE